MKNLTYALAGFLFVMGLYFLFNTFIREEAMPKVKLTTSYGDIVLELDQENAPISTENFVNYVENGFYDETIFHRVISGFMVQGGGFLDDMTPKDDKLEPITNEANNGLRNDRGTIAMARTSDPHSATSQFFINHKDNDFLNFTTNQYDQGWGYAVFGKVTEGLDVVDKIADVQTTSVQVYQDVPVETIKILKAEVLD
jgi:peptidyl-prolyl cis-trans isomerase B (cyclophilin B)